MIMSDESSDLVDTRISIHIDKIVFFADGYRTLLTAEAIEFSKHLKNVKESRSVIDQDVRFWVSSMFSFI